MHGGIKEKDIEEFLNTAKKQAKENSPKNLDTVVFFDEANTTDAIGLIKEIMCDRRLYGKPIPDDLKFVAACNPYRRSVARCTHIIHFVDTFVLLTTCRHSAEMIKKLCSAGLGFYVKETDTQQKLGISCCYCGFVHS